MAPMSPTYDRLEAGRSPPPSGKTKPKLFAWKKFALGAGLLLVLVWLFVSKEKRALPGWGVGKTPYEEKGKSAPGGELSCRAVRWATGAGVVYSGFSPSLPRSDPVAVSRRAGELWMLHSRRRRSFPSFFLSYLSDNLLTPFFPSLLEILDTPPMRPPTKSEH
ncbi:hypothetical protein B0H11DRAFT_2279908 [Mycena galericulata]|nr:hypothetical protein B0H11DRAFT_2279908 [Mycena galericulata]